MTFLIVASTMDIAAQNIAGKLIEKYRFKEAEPRPNLTSLYRRDDFLLSYLETDSLHSSWVDKVFDVEGVVFASRHKSTKGEPTLTVHAPGNPTLNSEYGGRPKELAWAWPERMRNALRKLAETRSSLSTNYKVSLEATHHGPTELGVPVWFVEIGSSEKYWKDEEAGAAVAEAIWASLTQPLKGEIAVGFGGGHYSPKHTHLCLEKDYAVGHIFSKYIFEEVDQDVVAEAFRKTHGQCETAIIDWKGMRGNQRDSLLAMLRRIGVKDIIKA